MVELQSIIQLVQAVGIGAFIAVVLVVIWLYMTRGSYVSSKADANQQAMVTKMMVAAQERSMLLEDHRHRSSKQRMMLLMRLQRLEAELTRLPMLEADVMRLKKQLAKVERERDEAVQERNEALAQLTEERLENAKLIGRIEALEAHIEKLERQIRRLQRYEREKIDLLDDAGVDGVELESAYDDIVSAGPDAGIESDPGGDGGADQRGERDGDSAGG